MNKPNGRNNIVGVENGGKRLRKVLVNIPDKKILRMERISDTLYFLKKRWNMTVLHN
jgi:hypothetical protein